MHYTTLYLALVGFATICTGTQLDNAITKRDGYIRYPVVQVPQYHVSKASKRQGPVTLTNEDGYQYLIQLSIGQPPQLVDVQLDTGSSELWVNPDCATANDGALCDTLSRFDPAYSSATGEQYNLSYGGGWAFVNYYEDNITVGSNVIQNQIFGVAGSSSSLSTGILGLAPSIGPTTLHRGEFLLDSLKNQNIINSRAFSLDLRDMDNNGSIIFGGVDTKKYKGNLEKCPTLTSNGGDWRYWISLDAISLTFPDGSSKTIFGSEVGDSEALNAVLDSGTTLTRLPESVVQLMVDEFPAEYDSTSGLYVVDCSLAQSSGSIDYTFGQTTISVTLENFILQGSDAICTLGVGTLLDNLPVLGDTFLRAAYVVFDQDYNNTYIAQAAECGSEIVAIESGPDGVPLMAGCS